MKKLIIILFFLQGCAIAMKPDSVTQQIIQNHGVVLQAITNYIADCQAKGICPKPEESPTPIPEK